MVIDLKLFVKSEMDSLNIIMGKGPSTVRSTILSIPLIIVTFIQLRLYIEAQNHQLKITLKTNSALSINVMVTFKDRD